MTLPTPLIDHVCQPRAMEYNPGRRVQRGARSRDGLHMLVDWGSVVQWIEAIRKATALSRDL